MTTLLIYSEEDGEHWAKFLSLRLEEVLSSRFPLESLTLTQALKTYPPGPQRGWINVKGVSLLILTPGLEEYLCENPDCTLLNGVPDSGVILLCGVDEESFQDLDAQPAVPGNTCNVRSITGEKEDTEQLIQYLTNFILTRSDGAKGLSCDKSAASRTVRTKPPKYGQGCEHKLYPRKLLTWVSNRPGEPFHYQCQLSRNRSFHYKYKTVKAKNFHRLSDISLMGFIYSV